MRDEDVFPARVLEHVRLRLPLSVPFGTSEVTWNLCTLMRTPSAISSVRNWSPTSIDPAEDAAGGDDFVARGDLARASPGALSAFFCCGRISRK